MILAVLMFFVFNRIGWRLRRRGNTHLGDFMRVCAFGFLAMGVLSVMGVRW